MKTDDLISTIILNTVVCLFLDVCQWMHLFIVIPLVHRNVSYLLNQRT